jgi:hypothetical protein
MNFRKLDAGLARALSTAQKAEEAGVPVFVRTTAEAGEEAEALLKEIGLRGVRPGKSIYSAELSPQKIEELSEKSWIHSITLSGKSRPLPDED